MAATFLTALLGAGGSGAVAEESIPALVQNDPVVHFTSEPVVQPLPSEEDLDAAPAFDDEADDQAPAPAPTTSLSELVASQPQPGELSRQMRCLAAAIYFEARGEPLRGQLAVGRVIVDRASSDRFPDSYCGVVLQRSQFSFVRGNRLPSIRRGSKAWRNAVAVAQIAKSDSWQSPTDGALFFHAARVSPGWHLKRLAQVGNHIFYR